MSDIPPTPTPPPLPEQPGRPLPEAPYDPTLLYMGKGSKTSGMAIAAMALGIAAIPMMCLFAVGLVPAIIAIILGIISLVSINRNPQRWSGKGFAITGIVTGGCAFVALPLMIAILLPSLGRAREMANRGTCLANTRGIVQAMDVYAATEADCFPVLPFAPHGPSNGGTYGTATPGASANTAVSTMYAASYPQRGAPLGGPWMLVMQGSVSAKQFLCKSDPHANKVADDRAPGGGYFTNFQSDDQFSYSFDYPYDRDGKVGGWWTAAMDASIPIASDMSPLAGAGKPARTPAAPMGGKAANSNNHQGEGQIVAFGDGHSEFLRSPAVGQNNDNIYTIGGAAGATTTGMPLSTPPGPINIQNVPGTQDTVMVPVRNLDTGRLW